MTTQKLRAAAVDRPLPRVVPRTVRECIVYLVALAVSVVTLFGLQAFECILHDCRAKPQGLYQGLRPYLTLVFAAFSGVVVFPCLIRLSRIFRAISACAIGVLVLSPFSVFFTWPIGADIAGSLQFAFFYSLPWFTGGVVLLGMWSVEQNRLPIAR